MLHIAGYALSLVILGINFGCSTMAVNAPGPLIESPEIQSGVGKFDFGFGFDDATRYIYTSDASRRPPTLTTPEIRTDVPYFFGRGGYALFDWLEVGLRVIPGALENFFAGIGATARAQLVGTGSGPGLKIAVYGGALQSSAAARGDQDGTFGNGGHNWKANAKALTLTGGSSIGFRFADPGVLIFIAGSYADQAVTGSIVQDLSSDGTSPAATYSMPEVKGHTRTASLGFRIGTDVQFGLDARLITRNWPGLSSPETRGGGESTQSTYALSMYFPH